MKDLSDTLSAQLDTYLSQIKSGMIHNNNSIVLSFIKANFGINTDTLRRLTGMPHQTVTSRISHLKDCGAIRVIGKIQIIDKMYSQYVFVEDSEDRDRLKQERLDDKFHKWLKRGLKDFTQYLPDDRTMHDLKYYGTGKN